MRVLRDIFVSRMPRKADQFYSSIKHLLRLYLAVLTVRVTLLYLF